MTLWCNLSNGITNKTNNMNREHLLKRKRDLQDDYRAAFPGSDEEKRLEGEIEKVIDAIHKHDLTQVLAQENMEHKRHADFVRDLFALECFKEIDSSFFKADGTVKVAKRELKALERKHGYFTFTEYSTLQRCIIFKGKTIWLSGNENAEFGGWLTCCEYNSIRVKDKTISSALMDLRHITKANEWIKEKIEQYQEKLVKFDYHFYTMAGVLRQGEAFRKYEVKHDYQVK